MQPVTHPQTSSHFDAMRQKPKGTYIFYGPTGVGKMSTVCWLAKSLHGHSTSDASCVRCSQIEAGTYPDLITVEPEKASIGIAQIQELQRTLNLSRHDTVGIRIAAIDQAEHLTHEAQNALLKAAEEPPLNTIIILLASSLRPLLTTIRSRSQVIRFLPLEPGQITRFLINHKGVAPSNAQEVAKMALGKMGIAIQLLANSELMQQYGETNSLVKQLCTLPLFERLTLVSQVVDSKKLPLPLFSSLLQQYLRKELRFYLQEANSTQALSTSKALAASIRLDQHLRANVSPKTALGALVLELG